jgi:hypothetical protein
MIFLLYYIQAYDTHAIMLQGGMEKRRLAKSRYLGEASTEHTAVASKQSH